MKYNEENIILILKKTRPNATIEQYNYWARLNFLQFDSWKQFANNWMLEKAYEEVLWEKKVSAILEA